MTDDIVTRLRENCACSGTEQFGYTCTSCDAADEIERLRTDANRWRALADRMHDELAKNWCWHCGHEKTRNIYVSDLLEDYRQAVIDSGVFNEATDGL